jgi:hypothetical protein
MKQAVVVIHGIGEQKPMDTLRGFVDAVLEDKEGGGEKFWSKPDRLSELFELRLLRSAGRTSVDFFEYYWAYLIEGTTFFHILSWIWSLIIRKKRDVPTQLIAIWLLLRGTVSVTVVLIVLGVVPNIIGWASPQKYSLLWFLGALFLFLFQLFLLYYVGDAARYLSPSPRNIALRQKIRADGIKLLKELHERGYDRIVVVGHSLGSVIAYDIITHLWHEYHGIYSALRPDNAEIIKKYAEGMILQPMIGRKLPEIGKKLTETPSDQTREAYREAQANTLKELNGLGNPWRISDLITMGSPLSHGMLLLARDREEFETRQRQKELPTCPPVLDNNQYAYPSTEHTILGTKPFTARVLHHAAPFSVTRWTNLYFPAQGGLFGDFIGGPLQPAFGPGVRDLPVRSTFWGGWGQFTPVAHVRYWDKYGVGVNGNALSILRRELALRVHGRSKVNVMAAPVGQAPAVTQVGEIAISAPLTETPMVKAKKKPTDGI